MNKNWYEKNWAIILFLILFFPVGIFLMWKYSNWNKILKIVISVVFALIVIGNMNSKTPNTTSTSTSTEIKESKEEPKAEEKTTEQIAKEKTDAEAKAAADAEAKAEKEAKEEKEKKEASIPTEYKTALKKAKIYSESMYMSKKGLYEQLTSENGEKFTAEAAQYAIDNLQADYKQNALKKAQTYQEAMSMSPSSIYDQLISEYGEKFTAEEAQYAIDNLK